MQLKEKYTILVGIKLCINIKLGILKIVHLKIFSGVTFTINTMTIIIAYSGYNFFTLLFPSHHID